MIGICPTPISWSRLQHLVQEDGSFEALSTLGRSTQCLEEYNHFKEHIILKEYASILDYVMISMFGCAREKRLVGTDTTRCLRL